jgi:high-affinity Fe2+/Pb2+ permease
MAVGRRIKRWIMTFTAGVMIAIVVYVVIHRFVVGVTPHWVLIPIGVGLMLAAVILPIENSDEDEQSDG